MAVRDRVAAIAEAVRSVAAEPLLRAPILAQSCGRGLEAPSADAAEGSEVVPQAEPEALDGVGVKFPVAVAVARPRGRSFRSYACRTSVGTSVPGAVVRRTAASIAFTVLRRFAAGAPRPDARPITPRMGGRSRSKAPRALR